MPWPLGSTSCDSDSSKFDRSLCHEAEREITLLGVAASARAACSVRPTRASRSKFSETRKRKPSWAPLRIRFRGASAALRGARSWRPRSHRGAATWSPRTAGRPMDSDIRPGPCPACGRSRCRSWRADTEACGAFPGIGVSDVDAWMECRRVFPSTKPVSPGSVISVLSSADAGLRVERQPLAVAAIHRVDAPVLGIEGIVARISADTSARREREASRSRSGA